MCFNWCQTSHFILMHSFISSHTGGEFFVVLYPFETFVFHFEVFSVWCAPRSRVWGSLNFQKFQNFSVKGYSEFHENGLKNTFSIVMWLKSGMWQDCFYYLTSSKLSKSFLQEMQSHLQCKPLHYHFTLLG